jgi:pyroglutamyl-peptidase
LENTPPAFFATINPLPLVTALQKIDVPSRTSYHAGIFGCNWLFYKLLHWNEISNANVGIIFIHLPPLPKQALEKEDATIPTMVLNLQLEAIREIIMNLT